MADTKRRKRVKNPSRKPTPPRSAPESAPAKAKRRRLPKAVTSKIVPVLMFGFFAIGVAIIILNYLSVLSDPPSNNYLIGGLGFILLGFVAATRFE